MRFFGKSLSEIKATLFPSRHLDKIEYQQWIRIWPHPPQTKDYLALFDTGAQINLIRRSVVHDLGLPIYEDSVPEVVETVQGIEVPINDYVQPKWQLHIGRQKHQKFRFFVVDELPDGLDVLVGNDVMNDIGISLRANKRALPLFPKGGKDSNIQKQPQHNRQILDGATRQAQRQKALDKEHGFVKKSSENGKSPYQTSSKGKDGAQSKSQNETSHK